MRQTGLHIDYHKLRTDELQMPIHDASSWFTRETVLLLFTSILTAGTSVLCCVKIRKPVLIWFRWQSVARTDSHSARSL